MTTAMQTSESDILFPDGEIQYDLQEVAFVHVTTLLMLFGTLLLALIWAVSGQWARILGTVPYGVLGCVTWYLLRLGWTSAAFRVLAWGAWICAVNGLAWTNGIYGPGVAVFFMVIAFSGYLVSSRTTIALMILSIAALFIATLAAQENWPVPIRASREPLLVFVVYLILLLVAGALGLFAVRTNRARIDRLRQSEAALAENVARLSLSESRLARAMDATSDGLWEWDIASGQGYFSPSYYRMLGYEESEFSSTADKWLELVHPEDRERALAANQDCIDNRVETFAAEFRMRAKNGQWRWILGRGKAAKRDVSGKALLMIGTHVDITERRLAEQDLRDWRERTRAAERVGGLGTWYLKLPGDEIRWSEGAYRIFGIDPGQDAPGWKSFIQLVHPDDRDRLKDAINALYRDRVPGHVEFRIVKPGGEIRHLLTSATLTCDRSGTPIEMIGASMDITEQKHVEDTLREREERLRTVTENAPDTILQVNREGIITFVNRPMPGLTREAIIGSSVYAWVPKEQHPVLDRTLQAAFATNERQEYESQGPGPHGEPREYSVRMMPVVIAGRAETAIYTATDITDRKRVEAALRLADQRLQQAVRVSGIGIFDRDHRTDTIYWSPEQRKHYGWEPDEPVTLPRFLGQVFPEDRERIADAVRRAHDPAGNGLFDVDHRIVRRDGEIRWLETRSQTFFEGEGEERRPVRTIGAVLDITEAKLLEEAHLRSQKLESLGTLAGGIAHDFNNILLAINGNAKLALEDLGPEHPARASVTEIARAGQRASDVVRRILTFSRQKSEKPETLDLSPVVEEALKLLRSTLPATIEFRTRFEVDVPLVAADPTQIHEAIVNLATNAAYAIGDRTGWIEFALEQVEVGPAFAAKVPGLRAGRYACLSVTDNGCGMDEPTVARIFDAFFTTKPAGQGTGLGLSMVHGILKGHQGAINVVSKPGRGSSFQLFFPAIEAQAVKSAEQRTAETGHSAAKRVLYIDDEEALVLLLGKMLTRLGHQVSGFVDAQEALKQFRSRPQNFDVVVTDLSMPRLSGFDVAREVHSIRADMPVIMTTGFIRLEDEDRAREAGIRELILKPNTVEDLGKALDRQFRRGDSPGPAGSG